MTSPKRLAVTGGGGGGAASAYIEDVFSTYLYTGNGSTQTITNGIDLSGKGGMVWCKLRSTTGNNNIHDTVRGYQYSVFSESTSAQTTSDAGADLTSFNSNGFSLGPNNYCGINTNGESLVSWTFRKQAKFFDVVTYTGNGVAGRTVPHSLGSVPGCIIVKKTSGAEDWFVYHRSIGSNKYLVLNLTQASLIDADVWNNTTPTDSVFSLGPVAGINQSGATYVAYLFAHDAGGFGLTGTDNVISCGSYTGNGSTTGPEITLGWEPQWVMVKRSSDINPWYIVDTMRGFTVPQASKELAANSSAAESVDYAGAFPIRPLATGFQPYTADNGVNGNGSTYIYIAIRRGPMKVPTSGTSVFTPVAYTGNGSTTTGQPVVTNFPVDLAIQSFRNQPYGSYIADRLRGMTGAGSPQTTKEITPFNTDAEYTSGDIFGADSNTQIKSYGHSASLTLVNWNFRRAPGFMDVVCYTGNGTAGRTVSHNLGVVPELMIVKCRNTATNNNWVIYAAARGATEGAYFTSAQFQATSSFWNDTAPTASVFSLGNGNVVNQNTLNFVAYLFASCPGVSKVGSYTGTGTTKQIDCGFTGGARFVMIKRTDSTGDWYVWDSARGIVAGDDPYLLLNSSAAEVTNTDYVDTYSAGFEISSTAPAAINANGGTFIFLAIA